MYFLFSPLLLSCPFLLYLPIVSYHILFCCLPSYLKGQCHEIFASDFFLESISPKPLIIPLGPFRIFSKFRGDIRSSRFGKKWKKTFKQKNFNNFVWTPLGSRVNIYINFCLQVHRRHWYRRQFCRRCRWHRWQICHRGAPWLANISANFRKNSKRSNWNTLGLGGNWFMKKTRSKKSRDTVPLSCPPVPVPLSTPNYLNSGGDDGSSLRTIVWPELANSTKTLPFNYRDERVTGERGGGGDGWLELLEKMVIVDGTNRGTTGGFLGGRRDEMLMCGWRVLFRRGSLETKTTFDSWICYELLLKEV